MRFDGLIKSWNDDRGFGFIEPLKRGQEIFVHIKAFPSGTGRPVPNLKVSFEVELSADGKKRAKNVQFSRPTRAASRTPSTWSATWGTGSIVVLAGFAVCYLLVTIAYGTPMLPAPIKTLICHRRCAGDQQNSGQRRMARDIDHCAPLWWNVSAGMHRCDGCLVLRLVNTRAVMNDAVSHVSSPFRLTGPQIATLWPKENYKHDQPPLTFDSEMSKEDRMNKVG